ncbi:MAG: hypothetical protein HDQ96_06060 [Lachnospiraceae bacterium]|nr:hypothetical protein [Lachnospiraceae bacterium]
MAKKEAKEQKKEKSGRGKVRFSNSKEAKRRLIPPFIMLTAGAITSILMVVRGCELHEFLARLLLILLVFYILGCLLKGILDIIDRQNKSPEPVEDENSEEAMEKNPDEEGKSQESAEEGTAEE